MERVEISPGDGGGRMVLKWASPHAVEVKTCVVLPTINHLWPAKESVRWGNHKKTVTHLYTYSTLRLCHREVDIFRLRICWEGGAVPSCQ
jgi:hypothetical protein